MQQTGNVGNKYRYLWLRNENRKRRTGTVTISAQEQDFRTNLIEEKIDKTQSDIIF